MPEQSKPEQNGNNDTPKKVPPPETRDPKLNERVDFAEQENNIITFNTKGE
jgi:hypothetical protein